MQLLKGIVFIVLIIGTKVLFAQKLPVGYFHYGSDYYSSLIQLSAENDFQYYSAGCMSEFKTEGELEKRDSAFVYKAIVTDTVLMEKLNASPFELIIKPADKGIIANGRQYERISKLKYKNLVSTFTK